MKATELRIGNLVQTPTNRIVPVLSINNDNEYEGGYEVMISEGDGREYFAISKLDPILLTEEWLLKFGFIKEDKTELHFYQYYYKGIFPIFINEEKYYYTADCWVHIECVHQLQNLYFALTGKELNK